MALYDMAYMTVSAGGTGNITLGGAAVADGVTYLTFAAAGVQPGDVVSYRIRDGSAWEIGRATYSTTGPSLTTRTVLKSTNANAAINVSNTAAVSIIPLAEDFGATGVGGPDTVTGGITANATQTQAAATQLTSQFNVVTVVANDGDGVKLMSGSPGIHCIVRNSAVANRLRVYPRNGDNAAINAQAVDAYVLIPANTTAYFEAQSLVQWFTIP